jgi:hypothetical protein
LTGQVARTCEIKPERIFVVLADIQAPAARRTPNAKRQTPNAER